MMSKSFLFLEIHAMIIHVDPRHPLYGGYAQVLCTNGIQCCFNYRQRIQSEQMTGLIAFHSKTMYIHNKTLPMGTSTKRLLSIYMLSRWISIETQRYHIDFWFRWRVFSIADNEGGLLSKWCPNHSFLDPRRPLYGGYAQVLCTNGINCCFINYRQRIQSEQMTVLIAFHWKSFCKYFMNKSHEAHLTISCFFFYETPGPCIYLLPRVACEKVRKKEWGFLKVSAGLS
jgi:hypothetical protein